MASLPRLSPASVVLPLHALLRWARGRHPGGTVRSLTGYIVCALLVGSSGKQQRMREKGAGNKPGGLPPRCGRGRGFAVALASRCMWGRPHRVTRVGRTVVCVRAQPRGACGAVGVAAAAEPGVSDDAGGVRAGERGGLSCGHCMANMPSQANKG
eukprot:356704-Chlamydomonas_euryale.AAC.3